MNETDQTTLQGLELQQKALNRDAETIRRSLAEVSHEIVTLQRRGLIQDLGFNAELPKVFDHSTSGLFLECERYFYYQYILGRRLLRDARYALFWGSVFHSLVESWNKNHDTAEIQTIIETNIPPDIDDRYGRTQARMAEAFAAWAKFCQENPVDVVAVEQAFTITCDSACPYSEHGCGLTYGGRMDRIVRWNQMVGPLDVKTTVMKEQDPTTKFRPGHQMEGYVWAASHLTGKHCWGAIVEQVICNKSNLEVRRFPIPFTEDHIREWAETERLTQDTIRHKFEEHAYDEVHWRQNKGRCAEPYNCPFREVCLSSRDQAFRYKWMSVSTTEERWDFANPTREPYKGDD